MHFATKTSTVDRLDVLRKGRRLPRLTVASEGPTIIADYCSSWLNGKRPAKRRESKIWLIIAHSLDNFIRSELPAWKGDMANKMESGEIWWNIWQKLRTILYNSTNALTLTSKSMTKPEPRTQICTKYHNVVSLSLVLHPIKLFKLGMVSESIRDCLSRLQSELPTFFRFLGVLLTYLNKVTFQQVITTCTCVAKLPNKRI